MWVPKQAPVAGDRSTYLPLVSSRAFDHPCLFDLDLDWEQEIGSTVIGPTSPFAVLITPGLSHWLTNAWLVQGFTRLNIGLNLSWPTIFLPPAPGFGEPEEVTMSTPITHSFAVDLPFGLIPPAQSIAAMTHPVGQTRNYGYGSGYRAKGEPSQLEWRVPQNYDHIGAEWDEFNPLAVTLDTIFACGRLTAAVSLYSYEAAADVDCDLVTYVACQANASVLRARTALGAPWNYLHTMRITIATQLEAPVGGGGPYEHESGASTDLPRAVFTNVADPNAAGFFASPLENVGNGGIVGNFTLEELPSAPPNVQLPLYCVSTDHYGEGGMYPELTCEASLSYIKKRSTNVFIG